VKQENDEALCCDELAFVGIDNITAPMPVNGPKFIKSEGLFHALKNQLPVLYVSLSSSLPILSFIFFIFIFYFYFYFFPSSYVSFWPPHPFISLYFFIPLMFHLVPYCNVGNLKATFVIVSLIEFLV
jgi:hypothetical protein